MRLVDTHCHLNDLKAFPNPAEAVKEAQEAGVDRLVVVAVDNEWSRLALELADQFEGIYGVVGWHPSHSAEYKPSDLEIIREMAQHPKCVAIGEVGLDFYWDHATREQQEACLHPQLDLAEELGKPLVFHCRDAYPDLLSILEARRPQTKMLFHCFSGTEVEADRVLALGCWLGVDGPLTYPKNEATRALFARLPREKVLIETDSPWMSPVPFRGKPNRPAWVVHVNRALAGCWGITPEESAVITTANAEAFFGLS
jgi:TatD DNase family protein